MRWLTRLKTTRSTQPWLIIFTDMTTLMLTFFVILAAISVVNEKNRQQAVASVRGAFGLEDREVWLNEAQYGSLGTNTAQPHGPRAPSGLSPEEPRLFADNPNIFIRYTETEAIVSMPEDLLFKAGGAEISEEGREALDRLAPYLQRLDYPALVAGYSAAGTGEGAWPRQDDSGGMMDFSWGLSLERSMAVYRHFSARGANQDMLRLEAYGRHRPRSDNSTPEGRRKNRRIELIIDRRTPSLRGIMGGLRPQPEHGQEYHFRDFRFNLDLPGISGRDAQNAPEPR
ncbi:MAG: OmpA family protein [Deltaproteobacteria bacterium]|jgi:chemotaxis protein MotB|nr:OmpA family protein [Deltaproteobacteria bacterium]